MPPDFQATSGMLWQGALFLALVDGCLLFLIARRIQSIVFRQLLLPVLIVTVIFWSVLWTGVLRLAWNWFYGYIFPAWAPSFAPFFGPLYGAVGLLMWWLARRLPGNPPLNFGLLGGVEGLLSHTWAIYGLGLLDNVPVMQGASPIAVLVFALFEKILYWTIILGAAALLHWLWRQASGPQAKRARLA